MLYIGSHVGFGKEKQLLGSLEEALSYGSNTFMFYTGAPTNTVRKDIDNDTVTKAFNLMKENNIDVNNVICHAPYIVNLGNKKDLDKWNFSINFLKQELKRCDVMNVKYMVLHPGNAVGISTEEALDNIKDAINEILSDDSKCMILLETMAGKGSEVGSKLEELATILDQVEDKEHIGVCLDTCHLHDAGYDLNNFDDVLDEFERIIGLRYIKCVHINDSKNVCGAKKDRHENIGKGYIGLNNLLNVVYNKRLDDIPKILETPYIDNVAPYKEEIELIRKNVR